MPEFFVFIRYSFVSFPELASFVFRVFVIIVSFILHIVYIVSQLNFRQCAGLFSSNQFVNSSCHFRCRSRRIWFSSLSSISSCKFRRLFRFCHFLCLSCQLFVVSLWSFPIVIFVSVTVSFESFVSLLEINCVEYWMRVICVCDDRYLK